MDNHEKYNECMRLIYEAINILDESYDNCRKNVYIEWHVYESPLEKRTAFERFREDNPRGTARHAHCDVTFNNQLVVKFVTVDDIMQGIEFTEKDTVYLGSKFTKESARKILSGMRG